MTQSRPGPRPKTRRIARILALRGTMSTRLITAKLGISAGAVSGVCFRADYPLLVRHRKTGTFNMIGTGHHGQRGPTARKHKKSGPPFRTVTGA